MSKQIFKCDANVLLAIEVDSIALSSNYDKRNPNFN